MSKTTEIDYKQQWKSAEQGRFLANEEITELEVKVGRLEDERARLQAQRDALQHALECKQAEVDHGSKREAELLAALRELERTTRIGQTSWTPNQKKALEAARAAIAQAEGETDDYEQHKSL